MLSISPINAFDDNYIWLLRHEGESLAAVVDPGEATPVLEALKRQGLTLSAILITHHHKDHVGGIAALKSAYPEAKVFGPASESIPQCDYPLTDGDTVDVPGLDLRFQVLDVGGHTLGHIAYYLDGVVFCGDTLFAGGCGRVFEGTHEQMHASLSRLAALPPETHVYCAHEYTLANLSFARVVEPDNSDLQARIARCVALRQQKQPTLPSTIADELASNPFVRCSEPSVIEAAARQAGKGVNAGVETFSVIRSWKDNA